MYAFVEPLAGTDVLEMDLQMTADGVLVVHHDATVDRRTETTGRVRDLTVVELQELDKAYCSTTAAKNETPRRPVPVPGNADGRCRTAGRLHRRRLQDRDLRTSPRRSSTTCSTSRSRSCSTMTALMSPTRSSAGTRKAIEELDRTDSVIVTSFSSDG